MTTTTEPTSQPIAELLFQADAVPMSTDPATIKSWPAAAEQLAAAPKYWLSTSRASGRPHAMPVLAVWVGGALVVSTRPGTVKGRNLDHGGGCVVTIATETIDLVVEGDATRMTDPERRQRAAAAFAAKYDWRFTLRDGRIHDDTLPGSPEYAFYEITPTRAFGYGADGLTATRWRF
ncbi:pyridoxamine 5'-phosphate oxidase family protein [Jiangella rhizosphaerae]|uniref:Pyridoxamine 5'-phosphate oxidase n=1 Tax=Jiangella rhizosphaerae TaxID=2293569 RepID=A0A418KWE5_9ACTN|nr:pyridoxamine 5'-phosphate oxidase family protein [Jiangella rhizosphaerae]RIQ35755.1 pyridoxamine 5'-phosphate oxidase [Jiangella rhizosphaerae]